MTAPSGKKTFRTKALRFGVIGLANTAIDFSVFAAAVAAGVTPLIANLAAWFVAITFSYLANSRWAFDRAPSVSETRSALRFGLLGAMVTLGVSTGIIAAVGGIIGAFPAKIIALAISVVLNFLAARWSIENRIL